MPSYLITGATGYVGSMLVRYLLSHPEALNMNDKVHITACVRDLDKAKRMLPKEANLIQLDLTDRGAAEPYMKEHDYIIHCAAITRSSEMVAHPTAVIESIVNTTQNLLDLAMRCHVKSMVYLSSMEVYGVMDCGDGHRVTEEETGYVNSLNVRSCYPMAKRMAENLCYCFYKEYKVPVKIARLAQTFGRGGIPGESRVFAQFAQAVMEKKDIVLHTMGNSMGNYCGIDDAVTGILKILYSGVNGEAYNVVNEENTMTIRQMAELVAEKIAMGDIGVRFDIPKTSLYGYAPDTGLRLSGRKLMALGWKPSESLEDMYRDLIGGR